VNKVRPYQAFADALRAAMAHKGMNASDVAREVWGSTTDKRGYSVGRNRDRIGHYLRGTSYPEPANLAAIAKALDVPLEDLVMKGDPANRNSVRRFPGNTGLPSLTPAQPNKYRLHVDHVFSGRRAIELFTQLFAAIEAEEAEENGAAEDAGNNHASPTES
jgi:transcriptional regulator with XRE-family HTH domain